MSTRRPNIVMILTDDHATHAISAYGSVVNQTPRIDEIAQAGRRFDRTYCTNALCAPSRASILTGTYSHVNGVTTLETHFDSTQPTFISLLRDAGYRTAIVGKWHLGEGEAHEPRGFDHWAVLRDQGEYHDPLFIDADGEANDEGYATDLITDRALAWVESLEGEEPWCLLVHHKAPHRSWEPAPRHADLYSDPIPVPDTFEDDYSTRGAAAHRAAMRVADDLNMKDLKQLPPEGLDYQQLALWKYQRYMEDYLRCVESVDENVGRLIDFLRQRGDFDDTYLMYSSDQGFFLGEHGWFDKRFMYEESILMPFVVSYPARVEPGPPITDMITNVDFAQTILEAAGVDAHPRMQGRSFWPQLTGEGQSQPHDAIYYRYWENDDANHQALAHYGVRTERHKLIYFYGDGLGLPGTSPHRFAPYWELFDTETDPDELVNVYDDPAYADVVASLKVRLAELQAEYRDEPYVAGC